MRYFLMGLIGCLLYGTTFAQDLNTKIETSLGMAADQYLHLAQRLPEGRLPRTYLKESDSLVTSDSGWWCSGFYPGTLLYLSESQENPALQREAVRVLSLLEKEQHNTGTHDLGFMMYCSFGNAQRLDPTSAYEDVLLTSARSLATRFNEKVGCIMSWNSSPDDVDKENDFVVIIDNMMNLELLFWAARHDNDPSLYNLAVTHADTTLENHFREDGSSFHLVVYDSETGEVDRKVTHQGAADTSAWARGQAWGLYGYVVMYRETEDPKYLEQAKRIAEFILNDENMPRDLIPYWDYDAPGIPDALRDSSAAAILASALFELTTYVEDSLGTRYVEAGSAILETLLGPDYFAERGTNGGFLLRHGVGHLPGNSEVDVPLSYGDYYLVEAMMRYRDLDKK